MNLSEQIKDLKNQEISIYMQYRNMPNCDDRLKLWEKELDIMKKRLRLQSLLKLRGE